VERVFRVLTELLRQGRWLVWVWSAALATGAAIPPADQLLPEDTLIVLTTPDFPKLRRICEHSAKGRLWNDPALKPLRDKFLSRWREEVIKPLERDLGLSLDSYASLPQGQLTFAVTRNAWQGNEDQPLGFLFLLDARDKSGLLRTNLAEFRKQWVAAGKKLRTETIRNLEFSVLPVSSNDVPKTLAKFLWRPPVFAPVTTGPDIRQAPVKPSRQSDVLLDMLTVLLTTSKACVIGQVDSLLVAGNSVKDVEKVVIRLTGGAVPTLSDVAAYQASKLGMFRNAPFYGWVNIKGFVDPLKRRSAETRSSGPADPLEPIKAEKLIAATGLGGCKTLAFSLQDSNAGDLTQFFLSVPEPERHGLFQILATTAKEAGPPPFVPADTAQFFRWRLDGPRAWATLEKMIHELSSQSLSALNLILDTASARARQDDPGFDLKQALLTNLGDDVISYERAPRGDTPAELQSSPSLLLLSSPNPEHLAVALRRLFVIFPQGDTLEEREFLGRKIFSVPVPPLPFLGTGSSRPTPPRTLSWAASGGYVALSTDTALLEEYLRSGQSQIKRLGEKPGLLAAAQKVGGMATGLFGYENEADTMRVAFEAARNDPGASTNGIGPSLFPGLPGLAGPEKSLAEWMDFSLLPPFDRVAPYFSFTLYAASANVDGLTFKIFVPLPPVPGSHTTPSPAPTAASQP